MDQSFHYDPAEYHEQVVHIAEHVVANDDAIPTITPRVDVETNSYHGSAIHHAERDRLIKLYPRLHL
ncbi:hypothetical protein D3273_11260 [Lichenibacterium minor]|jgi:hypothetical protein|uniref:Uncharacterized protein n=1 Tax=Lichenibacterium minor TaxID=2316528 RepID=A0A4Q2U5Y4_9HYPH|nr:hypothetical protein [Lichenibacterium minor]RYC31993.1 hypothetical protein D3273_11260 [Lichenibacterium minor]